jgi:hypothetical protein
MRAAAAYCVAVGLWAGGLSGHAAAQQRLLPEDFLGPASAPHVAVAEDGTAAVVFAIADEVWCSLSGDGGQSFAAPVRVGASGELEAGLSRGPRVAVTAGAIAVVAVCGQRLRGEDGDLLCWRSTDRGATWSEPLRINDVEGAAREGLHALAAGPGGVLISVWLDLRYAAKTPPLGGTELWAAWSDDGGATWTDDAPLYVSPDGTICECCAPAVAFFNSAPLRGDAFVFFRNKLGGNRDMYALGVLRGSMPDPASAVAVDPEHWALEGCPMAGGAVAISPTGTVLTFWRRESGLYAKRRTPEPSALQTIDQGRETAAAAGPGGFHLVWTDGEGQVMTAFDSHDSKERRAAGLGRGYNTSVAGAPDGQGPVIAVWETGERGAEALRVARLAERRVNEQK